MPARAPFTRLCQMLARPRLAGRADLHTHTTHSDGRHSPAEVVARARRAGLAAVAITDHDTLSGVGPAREAAAEPGPAIEVVAGAEITTEFRGRELHLLALFVRPEGPGGVRIWEGEAPAEPDSPARPEPRPPKSVRPENQARPEPRPPKPVRPEGPGLSAALAGLRERRRGWLFELAGRLRGLGLSVDDGELRAEIGGATPGRPHLARLLARSGQVRSVQEAFARYLADAERHAGPRPRLPVGEAIDLAHAAGGVTSWAHPPQDADADRLAELTGLGLDAVEVEFGYRRAARGVALRALAAQAGLLVTGGSDCHGPGRREVGADTVSEGELAALRERARSVGRTPGRELSS